MDDAEYMTEKTVLYPGDMIFLYTDGVTEAMNSEKSIYSDRMLKETIDKSTVNSAEILVKQIIDSVKDFAEEEPQSDDITILAVQFKGNKEKP
jgi:sigma-B regulation protein RsbU (phosphoserine phosphatase)